MFWSQGELQLLAGTALEGLAEDDRCACVHSTSAVHDFSLRSGRQGSSTPGILCWHAQLACTAVDGLSRARGVAVLFGDAQFTDA
jgi:hypothetical protein